MQHLFHIASFVIPSAKRVIFFWYTISLVFSWLFKSRISTLVVRLPKMFQSLFLPLPSLLRSRIILGCVAKFRSKTSCRPWRTGFLKMTSRTCLIITSWCFPIRYVHVLLPMVNNIVSHLHCICCAHVVETSNAQQHRGSCLPFSPVLDFIPCLNRTIHMSTAPHYFVWCLSTVILLSVK